MWGAIFCFVSACIVYVGRRASDDRSFCLELILITDAIQLFSDAMAYLYRGNVTEVGFAMTRISNFLVFSCNIVLILLLCIYVRILVEANGNKISPAWLNFLRIFSVIAAIIMLCSQLTDYIYGFDSNNLYYRGDGYWIFLVLALVEMLVFVLYISFNGKGLDKIDLVGFMLVPILYIVSLAIQTVFYGISLTNLAIAVSILIIFVRYEIFMSTKFINQQLELQMEKANVAEKNVELADYRAKLLLSQIQPHFLFNSLTAIKALTVKDPVIAGKAVDHLAGFLRASLDSLSCTTTIPIEKELKTTEDYLMMQKYRFGEKLQVEVKSELQEENATFMIPPFSIQPLVENAVHHGIRKKMGGRGTISVTTKENDKEYYIEIKDDGTGYDVNQAYNDGRNHYGVNIVKQRLTDMCNGTLEIESEIGVGTTCYIRIPKNEIK